MKCTRCGRPLKRARTSGMGAKCERAVLGPRSKRRSEPSVLQGQRDPDPYSLPLFEEQANA